MPHVDLLTFEVETLSAILFTSHYTPWNRQRAFFLFTRSLSFINKFAILDIDKSMFSENEVMSRMFVDKFGLV